MNDTSQSHVFAAYTTLIYSRYRGNDAAAHRVHGEQPTRRDPVAEIHDSHPVDQRGRRGVHIPRHLTLPWHPPTLATTDDATNPRHIRQSQSSCEYHLMVPRGI